MISRSCIAVQGESSDSLAVPHRKAWMQPFTFWRIKKDVGICQTALQAVKQIKIHGEVGHQGTWQSHIALSAFANE